MNYKESEQEQHRVYKEAIARNAWESKLHKVEVPINKVNHAANLALAQGRIHGTVYIEGKARQTHNEWLARRNMRRVSRSGR